MPPKVYLNGTIVAPQNARVSIFDRGFLYGDSVYETMRVYEGAPFAFGEHLQRLFESGRRVSFELPWTKAEVTRAVRDTLEASALSDAYLRVIATRGSGALGLDPTLATDPQLIVMILDLPALPPEMYAQGRSASLVSVERNLAKAIDPMAKTGNYMNNVLAAGEARRRQADEAIMLDHGGRVAEGSSANVFASIGGVWCTPPLEVGILSGITRRTILRLCSEHGIPAEERVLWPDDLSRAGEVFLCSSVREILPVVSLDGKPVGDGQVGDGVTSLRRLYAEEVRRQVRSPDVWRT